MASDRKLPIEIPAGVFKFFEKKYEMKKVANLFDYHIFKGQTTV